MYIFLDIDGVLNTQKDWSKLYTLRNDNITRLCNSFPDSKIILISSWKAGFISRGNSKNSPQIKKLESLLTNGLSIIGKTISKKGEKRNCEIGRFVKEHQIIDYIIIDDDPDEYDVSFLSDKHLMLIDSNKGF